MALLSDPNSLTFGLSTLMLVTATLTFVGTSFITAPYGRYSTSKGWGPLLPARAAWMVMESPNLWVPMLLAVLKEDTLQRTFPNRVLLSLFFVHYIHRAVLFPLRMPASSPMPLSVCALAFLYCLWNACLQSLHLLLVHEYPEDWLLDPRFLLGSIVFLIGMAVNIHADNVLMQLRAYRKGYSIPIGGLFDYVSCANYAGEIFEWSGYALATWSLPGLAFAVYTFSNLAPRAQRHHQWYIENFKDYPVRRRALIPFIW